MSTQNIVLLDRLRREDWRAAEKLKETQSRYAKILADRSESPKAPEPAHSRSPEGNFRSEPPGDQATKRLLDYIANTGRAPEGYSDPDFPDSFVTSA